VVISHRNACSNIHAIGQATRVSRQDAVASWLPLYHDMGLVGTLLFSVYFRLPLVLMSPLAFLARPSRWLWAIHDHRISLSPAPNFAYGLCVKKITPEERNGLDLSCWRIALNGAEPVNLRTVRDFLETYEEVGFRPSAMLPVYGLAEVTLAATFPVPGDPIQYEVVDRAALAAGHAVPKTGVGTTALVSVGRPIPGHRLAVVDAEGQPVREREVGHIVVSGPSVMQGYFGNEEATRAVLRDDILWTGDLGYLADGALYVSGRAKDVLIVHGKNYYAEDLERVITRLEGVRPGGVVAFSVYDEEEPRDVVVIVCEAKVEDEKARVQIARQIADEVLQHCGVRVDEIVLAPRGTIPKTPSGKPQRNLTREMYLQDRLTPTVTGKLDLVIVMARSGAGFLLARARRLFGRRADRE
jgi:acyl-CoA synthetase (AMP-forming)/AMP-acid ligase II